MAATQAVPQDDVRQLERLAGAVTRLRSQVAQRIVGQDEIVEGILTAVLAGGHALLIGVPGLAKTLMVQTVAEALNLSFNRVQFTPDLMPSDITGTEIIEEDLTTGKRAFRFVQGPVFANVVLADEINRTPPKTQAALLEAMQEHQVTAAGVRHPLPEPFFVLATQNPIEMEGTYPLPEAQLDRFLLKVLVPAPSVGAQGLESSGVQGHPAGLARFAFPDNQQCLRPIHVVGFELQRPPELGHGFGQAGSGGASTGGSPATPTVP